MRKKEALGLKKLAEAVIMQAIEDLWSKNHRRQSLEFFSGAGFPLCGEATGMEPYDQVLLLRMITESVKNVNIMTETIIPSGRDLLQEKVMG